MRQQLIFLFRRHIGGKYGWMLLISIFLLLLCFVVGYRLWVRFRLNQLNKESRAKSIERLRKKVVVKATEIEINPIETFTIENRGFKYSSGGMLPNLIAYTFADKNREYRKSHMHGIIISYKGSEFEFQERRFAEINRMIRKLEKQEKVTIYYNSKEHYDSKEVYFDF